MVPKALELMNFPNSGLMNFVLIIYIKIFLNDIEIVSTNKGTFYPA